MRSRTFRDIAAAQTRPHDATLAIRSTALLSSNPPPTSTLSACVYERISAGTPTQLNLYQDCRSLPTGIRVNIAAGQLALSNWTPRNHQNGLASRTQILQRKVLPVLVFLARSGHPFQMHYAQTRAGPMRSGAFASGSTGRLPCLWLSPFTWKPFPTGGWAA